MVSGLLFLHATSDLRFDVGGAISHLTRLPLPGDARPVVAVAAVVVFCGAAAARLRVAFSSNRARFRYEASSVFVMALAFFFSPNVMITTVALTCVHNVHYIALVHSVARGEERPLQWFDVVGAAIWSLVVHLAFVASVVAGSALFAAAVAVHYVIDGRLWRVRGNARLARSLGIPGPPAGRSIHAAAP